MDVGGIPSTLLAPVLTAILSGIGVVVQDWRVRRSRVGRRKLAIGDAVAQVEFIVKWWTARQSLAESPEVLRADAAEVAAWLGRARSLVNETEQAVTRSQPMSFRRLMLMQPFDDLAAKLLRVGFLVSFGLATMSLATSLSQRLTGETDTPGWVDYYLIAGALFALVGLAFRILAVEAEDRFDAGVARGEPRRGSFRTALLAYAFHRTGARVVRVLFYAGLVGVTYYLVWRVDLLTTGGLAMAWIPHDVVAVVVYGGAMLGLRSWALSLEQAPGRARPVSGPDPFAVLQAGWVTNPAPANPAPADPASATATPGGGSTP
jgi:hypothetical protein